MYAQCMVNVNENIIPQKLFNFILILGIPPSKKQISIKGRSYITFKGEQIYQMVIVWNYREMLLNILGIDTESLSIFM